MPSKINMVLHNGSIPRMSYPGIIANSPTVTRPVPTSLKANMIQRVHKSTPGCGACGKK